MAQSTLPLRADTVLVEKTGSNGELKIKNSTRDSLGFLVNIGGGRTRFMKVRKLNDSTVIFPPSDTVVIGGGAKLYGNGMTDTGDSVVLGGELDRYTHIRMKNNRWDATQNGFNSLMISDTVANQSGYWWLTENASNSLPYERAFTYYSKAFDDKDTLYKSYGGNVSSGNNTTFSAGNTRFKNISTPILLPYTGFYSVGQLFPPDTAYMQSSPFGQWEVDASVFGWGGSNAFRVTGFSQANITHPYPFSVGKTEIDFARTTSAIKREFIGNPFANYTATYKSHQAAINAGTTEYGSYIGKWTGFHAYGNVFPHTSSPSKAKTLAVSRVDTAIAFYNPGQYQALNEVVNGYGFVSAGADDDNHLAGRLRLGGSLPLKSTIMRRLHNTGTSEFTDTVYMSKFLKLGFGTATASSNGMFNIYADTGFQIGYSYGNRTYSSIAQYQQGITAANLSSKRNRGIIVEMDWEYSDPAVNITNDFSRAVYGLANHIADDSLNTTSSNGGIVGSEFRLLLRKRTAFSDTTIFQGGTAATAATGLTGTFDFAQSGLSSAARLNWGKGYHAALSASINMNAWHRLDHGIWLLTGGGQSGGTNSWVDTGYHHYMLSHDSRVGVRYALYQVGTTDSNYLAGPLRLPNLVQQSLDTTNYKLAVVGANGQIYKSYWQNPTGGSASLTTNYIGVGAAGVLSGSSAYTYDGTTVKQNNATAATSITSSTAVGSTSGGDIRLFAAASPTAADQRLGGVMFGTLDGGSTENLTASVEAYSTGAHTPGSSEGTHLRFLTTAVATRTEVMRITANLRVGIGVTAPTASLHLRAGNSSAGGAPFKLTSGTNLTTAEPGTFEYDGTSFFATPGSTRLRKVLTDNSIPSNGQIPIGNGTNYTNATITQGTGISVTNGSGSITIAVPTSYITAADYTPTVTGILNTDATSLVSAHYMRINDQVSVDVSILVDPTAVSTLTNVDITLPIASTMTNFTNLTGVLTSGDGANGNVVSVSNNARIGFTSTGTTSTTYNIHFMYRIQ